MGYTTEQLREYLGYDTTLEDSLASQYADIAVPNLKYFPTKDRIGGLSFNSLDTGDSFPPTYTSVENDEENQKQALADLDRADLWEIQDRMIEALEETRDEVCWKEAQRLRGCGSKGVGFKCDGTGCTRHAARLISCGSRFCVFCNRRTSAIKQEKYIESVIAMQNPMFMTLTQRAIPGEPLADARDRAIHGFELFRDSKLWENHVIGGVYSLEFTEKVEGEKHVHWHVHIHAIIDTYTGYIPLFRRFWRDKNAIGYRWSQKRKMFGETEELYQPRLEAALAKSEEKLAKIKTYKATVGRMRRRLDKTEEYAELYRLERAIEKKKVEHKQHVAWYKKYATATEVWLRCTRKAAAKAGYEEDAGNLSAYGVYLDPLNTVEKRAGGIREVLKYACKPIAISGPGLVECVGWLREKKRVLISKFGALWGVKKEEREPSTCPCCGEQAALRCVGMVDTMAMGISMSLRGHNYHQARETMRDLVGVLMEATGGVRPPPEQHGWGRQITFIERRANASGWCDDLMAETGLAALLFGEDDE